MGATNNAPPIWEYVTSTSDSYTKLQFDYTKNDDRVSTLTVILKDSSGYEVGSQDVDVSSQSKGSTSTYSVQIANNLSVVSVSATTDSITVNSGSSTTYTAPSDKYVVIPAQSNGCQIKSGGTQYPFSNDVIIGPSATVEIDNPTSDNVTITIYLIDSSSLSTTQFTAEFQEKDSNGNVLYDYTATVNDMPPLSIGQEGSVSIDYVG